MFIKTKKEIFDFIGTLILILILFYTFKVNILYVSFTSIFVWYLIYFKIPLKLIVIDLIVGGFCLGLMYAWQNLILLENLTGWIDQLIGFSIRKTIIDFINTSYQETTSAFINLILFNEKTAASQEIYYQMKDLSIVYLIAVSGFHLGFLKVIINRLCFKKIKISYWINILVIIFYCYLLKFSVSSMRVWIILVLYPIKQKLNLSVFDLLCLSGIIMAIISPKSLLTITFQLSYLATFGVLIVYNSNINNKIVETILANVSAILITFPIVIELNQEISLIVLINSFVFSYFICFIFVFLIITFWMIWISPVLDFIVNACYYIIGSYWDINISISINSFPIWITINYYLIFFSYYFYCLKKYYAKKQV